MLLWLAPSLPRIRYKVHHARLLAGENGRKFALHAKNVPKRTILGEQGEFCTAHAVRRGVLGEFCTGSGAVRLVQGESCTASGPARFLVGECCVASTPSESPVAGLPLPTGTAAHQVPPVPSVSTVVGVCTTRSHLGACHRRVGPSCSAIPPFGGVEAVAGADVVPKSRPARRKTPKMSRCGRGGLHFGLNGVGQGVRARRGPGSWAPR